MKKVSLLLLVAVLAVPGERKFTAASPEEVGVENDKIKVYSVEKKGYVLTESVNRTEDEWKKILTPDQFLVLRQKGTDRAYTGAYVHTKDPGIYRCAACGLDLFRSDAKFDSRTGWPSFFEPIAPENVSNETDRSAGMVRTEVLCRRCGGHLGHVFNDGPQPTGLRYCINSTSLKLVK